MARLMRRAFLVDESRRRGAEGQLAHALPEAHQVFVVALDLGLGARGAGRAQDDAHALGHLQLLGDFLQALAVGRVGDLARDAAATARVGHEHRIAAGERQIGGESCALVAALFLDDLDQQDLAALDDFLDLVLLARRARRWGRSSIASRRRAARRSRALPRRGRLRPLLRPRPRRPVSRFGVRSSVASAASSPAAVSASWQSRCRLGFGRLDRLFGGLAGSGRPRHRRGDGSAAPMPCRDPRRAFGRIEGSASGSAPHPRRAGFGLGGDDGVALRPARRVERRRPRPRLRRSSSCSSSRSGSASASSRA